MPVTSAFVPLRPPLQAPRRSLPALLPEHALAARTSPATAASACAHAEDGLHLLCCAPDPGLGCATAEQFGTCFQPSEVLRMGGQIHRKKSSVGRAAHSNLSMHPLWFRCRGSGTKCRLFWDCFWRDCCRRLLVRGYHCPGRVEDNLHRTPSGIGVGFCLLALSQSS